jgi:hypothetical protein
VVHPDFDLVASSIQSELIRQGRLAVRVRFPYATHHDGPSDWEHPSLHRTFLRNEGDRKVHFWREADKTKYGSSGNSG